MPPFQFRLPQLSELTPNQRRAVNKLEPIILTGMPGCGKTVVSIYKLLMNDTAQLFTYTRMLKSSIAHSTLTSNRTASTRVYSVHSWYWSKFGKMLSESIHNEESLTIDLMSRNLGISVAIFDEGQDLPMSFYKAFSKAVKKITIGADEAQQLYPSNSNITEQSLRDMFPLNESIELTRNFRNSFEIFNFARQFVLENPRANDVSILDRLKHENSGKSRPYVYVKRTQTELNNVIKSIINNYGNETIGVLVDEKSDVDYYHKLIAGLNVDCSKYHSGLNNSEKYAVESNLKNILVTTFKSAKGLEFDNVVMPNFHNAKNGNKKHYYVGATRARSQLFILTEKMTDILKKFNPETYELY